MSLSELAERCELAPEPSAHLDTQIFILLDPDAQHIIGEKPGRWPRDAIYGPRSTFWEWATDESKEPPQFALIPAFTASLDAALTLVPDGMAWQIDSDGPTYPAGASIGQHPTGGELFNPRWTADGETPALALCAAALKARTALGIEAAEAVGTTQIGPTVGESPTAKPERPNTGPHNV